MVRAAGEKHVLEEIGEVAPEELPTIKSVGYARVGAGGRHNWVSYVVTSKGKEVLLVEVSEPDMRQIALEQAKISFIETFEGLE